MLDWLFELAQTNPVAHAVGMLSLVCGAGMALGSIKIRGIGLGSAGVLFVGILAAHFTEGVDARILTFVREFGLVLFVFTIGLQLGPGFFASLRADGLQLNLLATGLVLLAGVLAPLTGWVIQADVVAVPGLFAGATTNTPALGAAQQSISEVPGITADRMALTALACAVAYPPAIAILLGLLVALKVALRIDPEKEARDYAAEKLRSVEPLSRRTLVVENPELTGVALERVCQLLGQGVVISRIRSADAGDVRTALSGTILQAGDRLLAVGTESGLDRSERLIGGRSDDDLLSAPGKVAYRRIAVTENRVLGKSLEELHLETIFGVKVTRITRGDVEMTAVPGLRLQFGDVLQVVGTEDELPRAAELLGNSLHKLNETQFIPLFAGIFLGVLIGSIPLHVPGLSQPLRLGLAGGPLIVALALGRIGHLGGMVWHMPLSANHAFREFGVALFFAALGLAAGDQFFDAVLSPRGLNWMAAGLAITVIPLLAISVWSRIVLRMNFVTLGGLLAGAMTNPPALTFVNNLCRSESPALAYATVYPLTTLLRILVAQILALTLCG